MTGVVSVVGVTPVNATPNAGRLAITLRSRDDAHDAGDRRSSSVCSARSRPIPGVDVYFQPVQDIQISTRVSRAQYQYTLTGSRRRAKSASGPSKLADETAVVAGAARRRLRGAGRRPAHE